jgi:pimeloyl-ACP methyl ester carboxylesterase
MARIVRTAVPETQYARNGDTHLAYQTLGEGPPGILWGLGTPGTHVEQMWEEPTSARSLRRIAAMGRLIIFDPRGSGLSDPVSPREVPTVDERVDDICAVLDAVGSQRAVVVGFLAGSGPAIVLTATHPERVESLVILNGYARLRIDDDYPIGVPDEVIDQMVQATLAPWGKGGALPIFAASMMDDERLQRLVVSHGTPLRQPGDHGGRLRLAAWDS